MEVYHLVPCWLTTFLMDQFFGKRNLGDLSPADKLWLITTVKKLHNGFKNTMMVDTSRNQWHVWLNLLLAMGCSFDVIRSGWTLVVKHSHTAEMIDFDSCFEPRSLAVDAATMRGIPLVRLRAVPHRQGAGCGLEAAAGRVQAGQVALRPGRRRQADHAALK
jgi:hypothetical protein